MARHTIKINRPQQVEVGYDDGTVTIYTGWTDESDEFVIDCATDQCALDLIANLGAARTAKAVVEEAEMAEHHDHWAIPKITRHVELPMDGFDERLAR